MEKASKINAHCPHAQKVQWIFESDHINAISWLQKDNENRTSWMHNFMSVPVRLCHVFVKVILFENILHKIFDIKKLKL